MPVDHFAILMHVLFKISYIKYIVCASGDVVNQKVNVIPKTKLCLPASLIYFGWFFRFEFISFVVSRSSKLPIILDQLAKISPCFIQIQPRFLKYKNRSKNLQIITKNSLLFVAVPRNTNNIP